MPVLAPERPHALDLPPLENGEHLEAAEFLRRYEAMPEVKKAELIRGTVFMGSPVRADQHGLPDNILQGWTSVYCARTPGVEAASNTTVRLGPRDVPQPDIALFRLASHGGQSRIDGAGYILGAPELVVEVAASSSAIDAHEKRDVYAEAGVREYLLWRTRDGEIDWWHLEGSGYQPLAADAAGIVRSRVFPGLWLDRGALLGRDRAGILKGLESGLRSEEHAVFAR